MARVLFSSIAGDAAERRAGFVDATSLAEADKRLRDSGHREIRYYSDPEFGDFLVLPGEDPERALRRSAVKPTVQALWPFADRLVLALAVAGFGALFVIVGWWWFAIPAFGGALVVLGIGLPLRLYDAVHLAKGRRQYRRGLWLLRALRATMVLFPGAASQIRHLLVSEEARMLAGSGRMDRALTVLGSLRPKHERFHELMLPSLYDHARDYETMARLQRERVEREPDSAMARIDLATTLAVRMRNLGEARRHIEHALTLPMTEVVRAGAALVDGLVLLAGDPHAARARIDAATEYFERQSDSLARGWLAMLRAFRARASALLGEHDEAERDLRAASPILIEGGEQQILDESWEVLRAARSRRPVDSTV